jgi:hypothetical protein
MRVHGMLLMPSVEPAPGVITTMPEISRLPLRCRTTNVLPQ